MNEDVHSNDTDISDEDSMDWLDALAKKHTGINAKGSNGRTALIKAVLRNDVNAVKSLLSKGADPLLEDNSNKTAMIYAAESDNKEIIELLKKALNG
jgi:ankyrin repeat protein